MNFDYEHIRKKNIPALTNCVEMKKIVKGKKDNLQNAINNRHIREGIEKKVRSIDK